MLVEILLIVLALLLALALKPWRLLAAHSHLRLSTPLLFCSIALPVVWAMPYYAQARSIAPHWSGACLVLLMLGWPLAILVFCISALLVYVGSPADEVAAMQALVWQGIAPATLALLPGWLVRRFHGRNLFVYTLGRCFMGSVLCLFATYAFAQWHGVPLLHLQDEAAATVGLWLMAWGDGIVTGMLCAIFVAFKPEWLATWSDALYLPGPPAAK